VPQRRRPRIGPGPPVGLLRLQAAGPAQAAGARPRLVARPQVREHGETALHELAARVTDRNFRLFAERACCMPSTAACTCKGPTRSRCSTRCGAGGHRPVTRILPRLRAGQAVTALTLARTTAGSGPALGIPDVPEKSHRVHGAEEAKGDANPGERRLRAACFPVFVEASQRLLAMCPTLFSCSANG